MANGFKTGGRILGTPNRITNEVRQQIKDIVLQNLPVVQKELNNLESKEKLMVIIKLMEFVIPKCRSVDLTSENLENITIFVTKDD